MVVERGDIAAVKSFLAAGRTDADLRSTLERLLEREWAEIEESWKKRALSY